MSSFVSIGIPVTESVAGLSETIDAVLGQTKDAFEIILVDDTTVEEEGAVCRAEAERDQRIIYVRTPGRFGLLSCHAEALSRAKGNYFLWLGVGDRLAPEFLSRCAARLDSRSDLALAIGRQKTFDDDEVSGEILNIDAGDPVRWVETFLEGDIGLDLWYGMFRRAVIETVSFRNAVGFEFAFLAEVAFSGKMETVEGAFCERANATPVEAEEADSETNGADKLGVLQFQLQDPYLVLAVQLFCNIAFLSDTFQSLPRMERLRLALRAYGRVAERYEFHDEAQFISFAVRTYPESRITDKLHDLRPHIAQALISDKESKTLFEPLSRAEEIINGLTRLRIGSLPATSVERDIVRQVRERFDRTKSAGFKNRAVLALALFA